MIQLPSTTTNPAAHQVARGLIDSSKVCELLVGKSSALAPTDAIICRVIPVVFLPGRAVLVSLFVDQHSVFLIFSSQFGKLFTLGGLPGWGSWGGAPDGAPADCKRW